MNYLSKLSLLVAVALLAFTACKQSASISPDFVLKQIPADVSGVTSIDLPTLMEKADFEAVKQMAFYKNMVEEAKAKSDMLGSIVADPAKSGIDLDQSVYVIYKINPDNPEEIFSGLIGGIKDAGAFETMVTSNPDFKVTENGGYKLAKNKGQVVAWTSQMMLVAGSNSYYADPSAFVASVFETKEGSISDNADLQKCFSGKHDIKSWFSSNALAENPQVQMMAPMAGFSADALKDNFIHSYVDFKDGAIDAHSDLMLQKALTEDLDLLFKDKLGKDLSKYVPAENLGTVMTAALDLEGVQQALQKRGMVAMANYGLKEYGLTLNDIATTFGGDIMLSSNRVGDRTVGTFVTTILDASKLDKFIALGVDYNFLEKTGDNRYSIKGSSMMSPTTFGGSSGPAELIINDKILSISGSADFLNSINGGGFGGSASQKLTKSLGGNIFGFFMNFKEISKDPSMSDAKITADQMTLTTGRKSSDFEMKFQDQNTNSLKQLFQNINEVYLQNEKDKVGM